MPALLEQRRRRDSRPTSLLRHASLFAACVALVLLGSVSKLSRLPVPATQNSLHEPWWPRWHTILPAKQNYSNSVLSSYKCIYDDGKSEHRVCSFEKVLLWHGELMFVSAGQEELPDIGINWLSEERLKLKVVHPANLPEAWKAAEVQTVSLALFGHQVNWKNFYHIFIETLPTWHNIICQYLHLCTYDPNTSLQIWTLEEDRGEEAFQDIFVKMPSLELLYACLTPHPLHHIREAAHHGKVINFTQAIVGLGPDVQAFHQWRPRHFKNWVAPPATMMTSWRQRLAECLRVPLNSTHAPMHPPAVTIVDRPYMTGRHMLNLPQIVNKIKAKWAGSLVQAVHVDKLSLSEQIAIFQNTSVMIWTHGAAMGNLLFLPQGAAGIELVPWPHARVAHEWAQSIQKDFHLPLKVLWTRLTEDTHLQPRKEVLFNNPHWQALNGTQRLMFLEKGICPGAREELIHIMCLNEWHHHHMSYVQPWEPLEEKLGIAMAFVQSHAV